MSTSPRWLIVRFRAIGDCVMAAWPASAIRQAFPSAQIDWVVESSCRDVIDTAELVNHRIEFPRDRWKKGRWSPAQWRDQLVHYTRLRGQGYDFGIDLQGHSKTALALRLAAPSRRISVGATDTFARALNPVAPIGPEVENVVDRHMVALRQLVDVPPVEQPIMPMQPHLAEGLGLPERLITVMTGASSKVKQIPLATLEAVCQGLVQAGHAVAFVGGPNDPVPNVPGILNLVGKTPLATTIEVIRRSAVHLAADTGTGHIAAALGVPVVSVFCNRPHAIARFRPYGPNVSVLTNAPTEPAIEPAAILQAIQHRTNPN